jgi:hypothetical protein
MTKSDKQRIIELENKVKELQKIVDGYIVVPKCNICDRPADMDNDPKYCCSSLHGRCGICGMWRQSCHCLQSEPCVSNTHRLQTKQIFNDFLQDVESSKKFDEPTPNSQMLSVLSQLLGFVTIVPGLKCGALLLDNGDISLVLQSLKTNRRINFKISSNTEEIIVIDEKMGTYICHISIDNEEKIRELLRWVKDK